MQKVKLGLGSFGGTAGAGGIFQIWVPDAEDATRTVEIHYRVLNAISIL